MRLCSDTWIRGAGAPMGGQARRPQLPRGQFRGFQNGSIWNGSSHKANLVLAHPKGLPVDEPCYLISNAAATLDLVWSYAERFCCELLFSDQKSGLVQLESSGLRNPERIDRPLLVAAFAVLASSLQGYALSIEGLRRQLDPHWRRGRSFVRIRLASLQQFVANATATIPGLDADPTATTGSRHPKPRRASTTETAVVYTNGSASKACADPSIGYLMRVLHEICRSARLAGQGPRQDSK